MSQGIGQGQVEDVGNEFAGSIEDALAAEAQADEGPAEQADPPEDDGDVESTWADNPDDTDPEAAEAKAADAEKPQAPVAPATLEISTAKGTRKFELTPDNVELKRELTRAAGVPKLQSELDRSRKAEAQAREALAKVQPRSELWDELQSLTQAGQSDRVVRAVLGDAYAQFAKQLVDEALTFRDGSPEERAAIERARIERDRDFERTQSKRELEKREAELNAIKDDAETKNLQSMGRTAAAKHDFRDVVDDVDQAHALNAKLWRLAWSDLEDIAEAGGKIDDAAVRAAFSQNFKVLSAGRSKAAAKAADKIIETKKQDAKVAVRAAATERYPTTAPDTSSWTGKGAKALLRNLIKGSK